MGDCVGAVDLARATIAVGAAYEPRAGVLCRIAVRSAVTYHHRGPSAELFDGLFKPHALAGVARGAEWVAALEPAVVASALPDAVHIGGRAIAHERQLPACRVQYVQQFRG